MHPQCLYGEDEEHCEEEYKKKGLISKDATFPCFSPHYHPNSSSTKVAVKILGVRCDGEPTCHNGLDEEGCRKEFMDTSFIGTSNRFKGKVP